MRKEKINSGKKEKLETILHLSCFTDITSDLAPESSCEWDFGCEGKTGK